jgi:hypothetical protein
MARKTSAKKRTRAQASSKQKRKSPVAKKKLTKPSNKPRGNALAVTAALSLTDESGYSGWLLKYLSKIKMKTVELGWYLKTLKFSDQDMGALEAASSDYLKKAIPDLVFATEFGRSGATVGSLVDCVMKSYSGALP